MIGGATSGRSGDRLLRSTCSAAAARSRKKPVGLGSRALISSGTHKGVQARCEQEELIARSGPGIAEGRNPARSFLAHAGPWAMDRQDAASSSRRPAVFPASSRRYHLRGHLPGQHEAVQRWGSLPALLTKCRKSRVVELLTAQCRARLISCWAGRDRKDHQRFCRQRGASAPGRRSF